MATRSWNRVELMGNLTRDPELRYTPNGAAVCTFSIATNRVYVTEGERKEEADFHRCVAWNKLAELCNQLLKKGTRVFVSGRLQNRQGQDPQGQTKYMTEIVIEDMIVLTSRGEGGDYSVDMAPSTPTEDLSSASTPPMNIPDELTAPAEPTPEPRPQDDQSLADKREKATETVSDDDLPF